MAKFNEFGEIIPDEENEQRSVYSKEDFTRPSGWDTSIPYEPRQIPSRPQSISAPTDGIVISVRTVLGILTGITIIILILGVLVGYLISNRDKNNDTELSTVILSSEPSNVAPQPEANLLSNSTIVPESSSPSAIWTPTPTPVPAATQTPTRDLIPAPSWTPTRTPISPFPTHTSSPAPTHMFLIN